jgi:hypothetical protein
MFTTTREALFMPEIEDELRRGCSPGDKVLSDAVDYLHATTVGICRRDECRLASQAPSELSGEFIWPWAEAGAASRRFYRKRRIPRSSPTHAASVTERFGDI